MMMTVLGVGSGVALLSTVNSILLDSFPRIKVIQMSAITCSIGFLVGLIYVTPVIRFFVIRISTTHHVGKFC